MSSPPNDGAGPTVIVVAGPTASGKSALALRLAEQLGGEVVNADSMQVYRELRILTDRPSDADLARVPHRLYGILPARERGSVAWWRDRARLAIADAHRADRVPVLCGGTGLYLKALADGIADIPPVPDAVVRDAAERYRSIGGAAFRAELERLDPVLAARLEPGDGQRLQRAWAVATATGRPLSAWQASGDRGGEPLRFVRILLFPPSPVSAAAVETRFRAMIGAGAVEEVRDLLSLGLDRSLPAMKALGVPQLTDFIEGVASLDEAVTAAVVATRRYAKRQRTWFRHQFVADLTIDAQFSESMFAEIFSKIRVAC